MDGFRQVPKKQLPPALSAQTPVQPPVIRPVGWAASQPQTERPQPTQSGPKVGAMGQVTSASSVVSPQPIDTHAASISKKSPKKSKKKWILWALLAFVLLIVLTAGGAYLWYTQQLSAVDGSDTTKKTVKIESGSTPTGIAQTLKNEGLIRNETAFLWYSRFEGVQNALQAGTYRLSPSETTPEIVKHLSSGKVDTFSITFLPGATLADNRKVLIDTGYTEAEVDAALAKTYASPLFAGKPASADLEGYIYGETYTFGTDTTVEAILEHTFAQFYKVIEKNDLVAKYQAQGFSLYQGITLASIIQKEAGSTPNDMAQISQVFHLRLKTGMPLGSDPTYQYAAKKMGVARDNPSVINIDSPYNTRRYAGLPPGPIAAPGEKALIATAAPADGDYLYFLSGDDDVTYFSRTIQEHEANTVNHCRQKCQIL